MEANFIQRIANETGIRSEQVAAALDLLDGGGAIPFVARYRKDVTGHLDEPALEAIAAARARFKSLAQRQRAMIAALTEQNKLTDRLREAIENCCDEVLLEDLQAPYVKTRRTKATVAREKGLTALADFIWDQAPDQPPLEEFAQKFVRPEKAVASVEEAIEGARQILIERLSLDPETRNAVRNRMFKEGRISALPTKNTEGKKTKFEMYYGFSEPAAVIPSHRLLALLRGAKQGFLRIELALEDAQIVADLVKKHLKSSGSGYENHIRSVIEDAYYQLLRPMLESQVLNRVRQHAGAEAIRVFRENARSLLFSPPAGRIRVLGAYSDSQAVCSVAVVDKDGRLLETAAVPLTQEDGFAAGVQTFQDLITRHCAAAVAIGNGPGSRPIVKIAKEALAHCERERPFSALVNESGAAMYAASKAARQEFPHLNASARSAVFIARRLQDPLAELVKIEPRHIGVGQYQHDVNQNQLRDGLHATVVSCVSRVGVDLNTGSESLLGYVCGLQPKTARNVVAHRAKLGRFTSRSQLLEVEGITPKVFEQCAGFLRITDGDHPLDATGIHPEAYPTVEKIAAALGLAVADLIGKTDVLKDLDLSQFAGDLVGPLALEDIRNELIAPGRDPRGKFRAPKFLEGVCSVDDLKEGMEVEGVVTNVTNFGAFVDIGIQQDGLIHLSELANRYVQDPRGIVKVGDVVRVKVIKVDRELPRISLSRKALLSAAPAKHRASRAGRHRPLLDDHASAEAGARETATQSEEIGAPTQVRAAADKRTLTPARPQAAPQTVKAPIQPKEPRPPAPSKRTRPERVKAPKGKPPAPDKRAETVKYVDSSGPLNTQLAEQLAAMRDKLGA